MDSDGDEDWDAAGGPNAKPVKSLELKPEDIENIAVAYEILTSKRALSVAEAAELGIPPLMIDEAMQEMIDLKHDMRHLARVYNFKGDMEAIFSALLIEELKPFDVEVLLVYLDYMHLPIEDHVRNERNHTQISIVIFNHHIRRLQRMRVLTYVEVVYFGNPEEREKYKPQVFHIRDDDREGRIPEEDDLLAGTPDEWFPQIGKLTIDEIKRCFDFHQAYHILMLAGSLTAADVNKEDIGSGATWTLTNLTSYDEVAKALISTYDSMMFDPRAYLTMSGPAMLTISEPEEEPMNLNQDMIISDPEIHVEIIEACQREGISTDVTKPLNVLFEEYTVAQLTPSFISHHGSQRSRLQASATRLTIGGLEVADLDEDDIVYYGVRDGTSKLIVFTIEELHNSFASSDGPLFNPVTILQYPDNPMHWEIFPNRTIARLIQIVLPHKRRCAWTQRLASLCRERLESPETIKFALDVQERLLDDLSNLSAEKKQLISTALVSMYNAGVQLIDYEEDIAFYDDYGMTEQLIQNPLNIPGEPETTGRPQAVVRNILMEVSNDIAQLDLDAITFGSLVMIKNWKADYELEGSEDDEISEAKLTPFSVDYADSAYTISNYLKLMYQFRFGMTKILTIGARWLMVTASIYHKKILGHMINDFEIEFTEETLQ